MAAMTQDVRELFETAENMVLCTASADGTPNGAAIGMKTVIDEETIYISDQFFKKTLANLKENQKVAVAFWTGHDAFQIHGTARYVNEGDRRDVCANAAVNTGFVSTYAIFTEPVVAGYVRPEEIEAGIADGRILKADTLDELAEKINGFEVKGMFPTVTGDNLKATIEKHNGYIDNGEDLDFHKVMASTMVKIEEGPYYALPQFPSVHHTMGGLVIDTMTRVLDIYGQPIEGLYAAGEVTGGVHGTNRLGSNADADACGFGYISGIVVATGELPDFIPAE